VCYHTCDKASAVKRGINTWKTAIAGWPFFLGSVIRTSNQGTEHAFAAVAATGSGDSPKAPLSELPTLSATVSAATEYLEASGLLVLISDVCCRAARGAYT